MRGETLLVEAEPGLRPESVAVDKTRPARPVSTRTLHPPDAVAYLLQRERVRSERTGHEFALVLLEPTSGRLPLRVAEKVGRRVATLTRLTDEPAWYDAHRICAILPETDAAPRPRAPTSKA